MRGCMKTKKYVVPLTLCVSVQTEGCFASSLENDAVLDPDAIEIEVEEYATIENDVAFK